MAGGSGQGTAGSTSAAVVGSCQYTDRSSSAAAVGSGQGASRVASTTWVCPDGMDPNSSYLIKIKLFGNQKNARKDIRCFCFEKIIDCDLTNYKDLVESIVEQYPPGYLEVAHVQYYDDALKICPERGIRVVVRKSGQHLCPICKEYGHHWHKCKKGNKDDIVALMDVREPPKKRRKTTKSAESSIVPRGDEAPAAAMYFPPRQSLEITTKKKGKHGQTLETTNKNNAKGCKRSGKGKKMELAKKDGSCHMVPFGRPAMGTRSKKTNPANPQ